MASSIWCCWCRSGHAPRWTVDGCRAYNSSAGPLSAVRVRRLHGFWRHLCARCNPSRRQRCCAPVVRAIEQRNRASPRSLADESPSFRYTVEFGKVPAAEFLPFLGIVAEPLPQFSAGSGIFQPTIDSQRGLFHPARPKPLDKVACPILGILLIINSFQFDHLLQKPPEVEPTCPSFRCTIGARLKFALEVTGCKYPARLILSRSK